MANPFDRPARPSPRRHLPLVATVALCAAAALLAGACSGGSDGATSPSTDGTVDSTVAPTPTDYSGPGPYPVGTAQLSIGDGQTVFLYYPADPARLAEGTPVTGYSSGDAFPAVFRAAVPAQLVQQIPLDATLDAPVADGPFPVVLFSHGFASYPEYSAQHLAHLASWGFFTAAPDHTSRDLAAAALAAASLGTATAEGDDVVDLRETLALLRTQAAAGARFDGALDFDQVAAEGHSAGGAAAAALLADDGIDTFIGQAPASPLDTSASGPTDEAALAAAYASATPPPKPSMIITGEDDGVIPLAGVTTEYSWLAPPKRLAVLAGVGHNAFTDICKPIRDQGGLSQFADQLTSVAGVFKLGEDGCTDGYLDPTKGYAVINHLTVAQLRWVFGLDPTDASLTSAYLDATFPGTIADYRVEGSTASGQG